MKTYEEFYKNGFEILDFNPSGIDFLLSDMLEGNIKKGFSFEKKYDFTLDLRPNVLEYSDKFLSVLKDNNLKKFIRNRTLKDLTLYHIQVRIAQSTTSYMDWHRDSYYNIDKKIGMFPPSYKLIYYPHTNNKIEPRLKVSVGSNRTMIDNPPEDLKLISFLPKKEIYTSNDKALFFETSLLHAVVPDPPGKNSIRLIYTFVSKEQLEDLDPEGLHVKTSKLYEELV